MFHEQISRKSVFCSQKVTKTKIRTKELSILKLDLKILDDRFRAERAALYV